MHPVSGTPAPQLVMKVIFRILKSRSLCPILMSSETPVQALRDVQQFSTSKKKFLSVMSKMSLKLHKICSCLKILVSFRTPNVVLYKLPAPKLPVSMWTEISVISKPFTSVL